MASLPTSPAVPPPAGKIQTFESGRRAAARPVFSAVERTVLDLAWRDAQRLQLFDRLPFRRLRHFFGFREPLPLADPRLETLRQQSIILNRGLLRADAPLERELRQAGYSSEQVATLKLAMRGSRRGPSMG